MKTSVAMKLIYAVLLLFVLSVYPVYGHSVHCGISCPPAGPQPVPRIPDNFILQILFFNQQSIFYGIWITAGSFLLLTYLINKGYLKRVRDP